MMQNWKQIVWVLLACQFFAGQVVGAQEVRMNLKPFGVSDRDLLKIGTPAERIAKLSANQLHAKSGSDTLRILAIRVDFPEDTNRLTTGNGKFNLTPVDGVFIDPPPHDLTYFEHQLMALANYYKTVSDGKLILQFEVYPRDANGSYTVANEMSFYTPTTSEELLDQRISELFQEAMQLADATDAIDFSQFDSYVMFHAGVGSDFAFDFDPTPQDIPSVFLDFATLEKNLGNSQPDFQGIPVNNGTFFIRDGIILPETQSQEGLELALLGTMAIMFGNQLGLPILFNPDNGRSGVGIFGLMDQGSGNFTGLIPAEPCAWSKMFLGWQVPITVRNGENLPVAAAGAGSTNQIYKIPINANEYFLVENRNRDINNDGIAIGRDAAGTRVEFLWDEQGQRILADAVPGVITQVSEYDFGLPGSGILIWHIDENVIAANIAENRVNADPERRGVDLEEADGAQDLGQFYGFLDPGSGAENGVIEDMFWGSNEINMLVNDRSSVVAFTPNTTPNSRSNSGANSHIYITDFSEPDSVMTFSVREDITLAGFPQYTGVRETQRSAPTMADLDGDGVAEIIFTAGEHVLVWKADGSKFIANADSASITGVRQEAVSVPLAVFASPGGSRVFSPAVAKFATPVVVVATDRSVGAYLPVDANSDGRADVLFDVPPPGGGSITTSPLVQNAAQNDFSVFVGTSTGDVVNVSSDGTAESINVHSSAVIGLASAEPDWLAFTTVEGVVGELAVGGTVTWQRQANDAFASSPVIADLNQDGAFDVIAVSATGELLIFDRSGEPLEGFPVATGKAITSGLAIGDIDADGFMDIVFAAGDRVFAYDHFGNLKQDFPIRLSPDETNNFVSKTSPVLLDSNGDGRLEIIVGHDAGEVMAFDITGRQLDVFPVSAGGAVSSAAFVNDLDNDGDLDLAAAAADGFLYLWDLPHTVAAGAVVWNGLHNGVTNANANLQVLQQQTPGGGDLMPAASVYNYPNPTDGNQTTIRYRLNSPADVKIKIYDLAGEFVDELTGTGFSPADNEIEWRLDNIESGVYLARVEARGDTGTDVAIIKIAVVK